MAKVFRRPVHDGKRFLRNPFRPCRTICIQFFPQTHSLWLPFAGHLFHSPCHGPDARQAALLHPARVVGCSRSRKVSSKPATNLHRAPLKENNTERHVPGFSTSTTPALP